MNLSEVANIDEPYNVDVEIKKRQRWYNGGKRARKSDLTIVVYEGGSTSKKINDREVALHQTPKAMDVADNTGGGIFEDGELVAVMSDDNIIHFLTEDKEIITKHVTPLVRRISGEQADENIEKWAEFLKYLNSGELEKLVNNKTTLINTIARNEAKIESIEHNLKELSEFDWVTLEQQAKLAGAWARVNVPEAGTISFKLPGTSSGWTLPLVEDEDQFEDTVSQDLRYLESKFKDKSEKFKTSMARLQRRLKKDTKEAEKLEARIEEIQDGGPGIEELQAHYNRLLCVEGYECFTFSKNKISGVTKDVICSYNGYEYRLGSFRVDVSITKDADEKPELSVRAYAHRNNHHDGNYYHPHVNTNGAFCSGNMKEALKLACKHREIINVFTIAWLLLSEYNENSPYVQIIRWPKWKG